MLGIIITAQFISNFLPFSISPPSLLSATIAIVVSGTTGLLFGIIPANTAANKEIIEIIR